MLTCSTWVVGQTQLPAESIIPGEKAIEVQRLPAESSIPNEQSEAVTLPAESQLPTSQAVPIVEEIDNQANEDDQADPIKEFSKRPILRVQGQGSIAPIQSICFTPDSNRILVGGQDKALHVWRHVKAGPRSWGYEKAVYWQINRANQGHVNAVSASQSRIAFAGVGASASSGEIVLVDPEKLEFSRAVFDLEQGHVDSISDLEVVKSGELIASIDIVGKVIAWQRDPATGKWVPSVYEKSDYEKLGAREAGELVDTWRRRGSGIAVTDSGAIFYGRLAKPFAPGSAPSWQVVRAEKNGNRVSLKAAEDHLGIVTAIAVSADGNRIVSADLQNSGRLFFWDLARDQSARIVDAGFPVRCLSISNDGTRVMMGTARNRQGVAQVRLWDWAENSQLATKEDWEVTQDVECCALNVEGSKFAYSQGKDLVVGGDGVERQSYSCQLGQSTQVTFSNKTGDYRIAFNIADDNKKSKWTFDPTRLTMQPISNDGAGGPNDRDFPSVVSGDWRVESRIENEKTIFSVVGNGRRLCQVPIDLHQDGAITATAFVMDRNGQTPRALIVGTAGQFHIKLYSILNGQCKLLRAYRGHTALVTSVAVSADEKYLVSSSRDGTLRYWQVGFALGPEIANQESLNRWGASFESNGEFATVRNVIADGPLYYRGVREGDIVEKISWIQAGEVERFSTDAKEIGDILKNASNRWRVKFEYRRGNVKQPYFYLFPSWQPFASFVWNEDREWAFWTPYGYYEASFNGHKLFGWQINRGENREVGFFRAAELKEEFERPEIMKNLLSVGSVEQAFELARIESPTNLSNRLQVTRNLSPKIKIDRVESHSDARSDSAFLVSTIQLPVGVELAKVRAFANGVPAIRVERGRKETIGTSDHYEYRFRFNLPGDETVKLQVLASSSLQHGSLAETIIERKVEEHRESNVFLLSLGVSDYQDNQIPRLDFAHINAKSMQDVLLPNETELVPNVLLTNSDATKGMWSIATQTMADRIRSIARPDDVLILFLSGHGFRDPVDQNYFYLTSNSRYSDVMSRRYADCISLQDLSSFADIPCRKVVILDTCHSGAMQVLEQQNLKSIVRALENDLFFVLTSSEGSQESFESKQRGMGLFTSRLIDALNGQSDLAQFGGDSNGEVSLQEVVNFVQSTVPDDAARLGNYQFPTAAPLDLLPMANIRLKSVPAR